jgi:hypothetical protein
MASDLHVEYPGAFYHVINRGNAGDDIFKSLHLNPIRANLETELCLYPFSSYPAFIGQVKAPKWFELY